MAGEIGHHPGRPRRASLSLRPVRLHGAVRQRRRPRAPRPARSRPPRTRAGPPPSWCSGDGTPAGIKASHVAEAARAGEPFAMDLFEQTGRWVGQVLADLASILDPPSS